MSLFVELYSDEDVSVLLSELLKSRGFKWDEEPLDVYLKDHHDLLAEKKIDVIVDRSALPGGSIKILSWKEMTE